MPYSAALITVDNRTCDYYYSNTLVECESGGTGRRTGLRIQPAKADRGSTPLSRTMPKGKPGAGSYREFLNIYKGEGEWTLT